MDGTLLAYFLFRAYLANKVIISQVGADLSFSYAALSAALPAKTITLAGMTLGNIASNITFTNTGVLRVGDGLATTTNDDSANTLLGSAKNDMLIGLGGNDTLTGGAGNDLLNGGTGDDSLDGGTGSDSLIGGSGNDTYVVDSSGDVVSETSSSGGTADTVKSSISYTLVTNVEHLTLTGTAALNGTGNTRANTLTGNTGNNILNGKAGADTMIGLTGNDTYVVDRATDEVTEGLNAGTDTVQASATYTLAANVENLQLMGGADLNGTGNDLANLVYANSGDNVLTGGDGIDTVSYLLGAFSGVTASLSGVIVDTEGSGSDTLIDFENLTGSAYDDDLTGNADANTLDGGAGSDYLRGGAGDDTYLVDGTDTVIELVGGGTDTVVSGVSYRLSDNVENLTLGGTARTGTGNSLANTLRGNASANFLDGKGGIDTMIGLAGNDIYVVDDSADTVTEALNAGTDTVLAFNSLVLGANVENLQLMGTSAINGTGNTLNNTIWANRGNNVLNGAAGTDTISYEFGAGAGVTVSLAVIAAQATGGSGSDTLSNFENLTGSNYDDTLSGNSFNNTLDGGLGLDTLSYGAAVIAALVNLGGLGASGTASGGGGGSDSVRNFENVTGGSGNDSFIGTIGDNVFSGGDGTDTVSYQYITSATALTPEGVTVSLSVSTAQDTGDSGGIDTLIGIENLTGGALADTLTGNALNNVLDGKGGDDILAGLAGDDTYIVDNINDTVSELAGGGTDTVKSTVTYTLADNVENLELTGSLATINGTGNALANTLKGNAGQNRLDGGAGADTMTGGDGNDTYVVGAAGDTVVETSTSTSQIDTVESSITYTLGANLEKLLLTGATAINGSGNERANTLTGNSGNNTLSGFDGNDSILGMDGADRLNGVAGNDTLTGGAGNDTLTGGAGNDSLTGGAGDDFIRFDSLLNAATNRDTITDFNTSGNDTMQLEDSIFSSLTTGALAAGSFLSGAGISSAADDDDFVIYNSTTGALYYDTDGNGAGTAVQFAILTGAPVLSSLDFVVS
jgi:Ca2+-binding RTX toxin-like protein